MTEVSLKEGWDNVTAAVRRFNQTPPNSQLYRAIKSAQTWHFGDAQAVAQSVAYEATVLYDLVWKGRVLIPDNFRTRLVQEAYANPAAAVFVAQALDAGQSLARFYNDDVDISGYDIPMPGIDMVLELLEGDSDKLVASFGEDRTGKKIARYYGYSPEADYLRQFSSFAKSNPEDVDGIQALSRLGADRFVKYSGLSPFSVQVTEPGQHPFGP